MGGGVDEERSLKLSQGIPNIFEPFLFGIELKSCFIKTRHNQKFGQLSF